MSMLKARAPTESGWKTQSRSVKDASDCELRLLTSLVGASDVPNSVGNSLVHASAHPSTAAVSITFSDKSQFQALESDAEVDIEVRNVAEGESSAAATAETPKKIVMTKQQRTRQRATNALIARRVAEIDDATRGVEDQRIDDDLKVRPEWTLAAAPKQECEGVLSYMAPEGVTTHVGPRTLNRINEGVLSYAAPAGASTHVELRSLNRNNEGVEPTPAVESTQEKTAHGADIGADQGSD